MKLIFKLLAAGVFVFGLDWASKVWAEQNLLPYQPVEIIGNFFRLTLGYNTGVAFGMFANGGLWPLLLTGVIIVGLVGWFTRALLTGQIPATAAAPVGFLLGGAIGNFIDRLPDGRVTDFLDAGLGAWRWPTFNLADSFILTGVALLVLLTFNYRPAAALSTDPLSPESQPDNLLPS